MTLSFDHLDVVDFEKGGGLICAVVQDHLTLQVLMVAWMDRAALAETIESGEATFFSRTRQKRWRKGETSGHRLKVLDIVADCDRDSIVLIVEPAGPACHTGAASCFAARADLGLGQLGALQRVIEARAGAPDAESYTARLLREGPMRAAQKLGEEGVEAALAGVSGSTRDLADESADLLYHLLVLLKARAVPLADVMGVLSARAQRP